MDEKNIAHLVLQVDTESFDAIAHGIGSGDAWQVCQGLQNGSLLGRLLKVTIIRVNTRLFEKGLRLNLRCMLTI